jgi:hypothetical protein
MEGKSSSPQRMNQAAKRGASAPSGEAALKFQLLALTVASWMTATLMSARMAGVVFTTGIAVCLVIMKVLGTKGSESTGGEWISMPQQLTSAPGDTNLGGSSIGDCDSTKGVDRKPRQTPLTEDTQEFMITNR